jgi:hypothetical protein
MLFGTSIGREDAAELSTSKVLAQAALQTTKRAQGKKMAVNQTATVIRV